MRRTKGGRGSHPEPGGKKQESKEGKRKMKNEAKIKEK